MWASFKPGIDDHVLLGSGVDWNCLLVFIDLNHVIKNGVHVFFEEVLVVVFDIERFIGIFVFFIEFFSDLFVGVEIALLFGGF
jgi:hypothetical protein